jgi:D-alanyl-D-alanine carboxypeptidase (penicillin-binding protein 5/6)
MQRAILLLGAAITSLSLASEPPSVSAKSAIVVDERSGKVLYSKAPDSRRFPASTTKILTALLLLEMCPPEERVVAPADIETITGSSLHLKPGEAVTARDMAYALIVRSANDGSYAVAVHLAGSVKEFARLMNERAAKIGCKNTHFTNASGLHDPMHYSSARDLSLIAREAMRNPEFRKVAATRKVQIGRSVNQEDVWLISKNKPLETDPTADGIKTGYTNPAGQCYVGSATRMGYRFITVVLASESWKEDHKALIDWAFQNYKRSLVASPGDVVGRVKVQDGPPGGVEAEVVESVFLAHRVDSKPAVTVRMEPTAGLAAPVAKGQPLGEAVFEDGDGWTFRAPVVAAKDADRRIALAQGGPAWTFGLFALALGGGAYAMRRKSRRAASYGIAGK